MSDEPTKKKKKGGVPEKGNVALGKMQVEYIDSSKLMPNPWNPNRQSAHEFEMLCRSIEEDGFTQPIVAVTREKVIEAVNDGSLTLEEPIRDDCPGMVVDGEHRWRASQALGMSKIPVVFTSMTPAQARIATLRHNRARGEEDEELVGMIMRDLRDSGNLDHAADSLLLDETEINMLTVEMPDSEAQAIVEDKIEKGEIDVSVSGAAADEMRKTQKQIADARNEQEKEAARRDAQIYRLALVFHNDEADVVKRVLGQKPVDVVVELCKQAKQ